MNVVSRKLKPQCLGLFVIITLSSCLRCSGDESSATSAHPKTEEMSIALFRARTMPEIIPPVSHTYGPISIEQAYLVQDQLAEELLNVVGPVKGYKVGFASESVFEQFGISEPAYGRLYTDQIVENGESLNVDDFFVFNIEAEVALKVGKRIDKEIQDVGELAEYIESVHVGLDISNNWYDPAGGAQTVADFVANSGGSHFFVLGPAVDPDQIDLDNLRLKVLRNEETVYEGLSTEVMGSPWNIMKWIANHTLKRGYPLEPGFVIFTGKVAPQFMASGEKAQGSYIGHCGELGEVRVTLH